MSLGNTAYCVKLSGEDLSRYSNKIEAVGFAVRIITILIILLKSDVTDVITKFLRTCLHHGGKNNWWRYHVTVTLCIYRNHARRAL